ncbi:hypothetical protein [Nocardioides sp.]|uniref:hypothetical protein n=1 Tax=Nocardioides sp. TaxID=35761 RepID=UPI0027366BD7|nr:hypothetical protein [Nocardioides sp.]MDP3889855.1 hypothetical protein [Nocardioides sp.]
MSMRSQIQQILDQAATIDAAWAEVIEETGNHPPAKAWEADDEARRDLAASAVQVLHDLLALADKGEPITLTPEPREVLFMVWDGGPEKAEHEEVTYQSPHGERYNEVTFLEHGATYTVCPWCHTVESPIVV